MTAAPDAAGISRAQAVLGTIAVVLGGCALVVLLGVVFASAGGSRGDDAEADLGFDAPSTLSDDLEVASGGFAVEDGVLRAVDADPAAPAVALTDRHAEDGRLAATAVAPGGGWGLVVRWEGAEDHWRVATPAGGGPLEVVRVEGGTATVVDAADAPLRPGQVVDVRYDHRRIDVRVDGTLVATVRDEAVTGRRVGVVAPAPGAAWDDLRTGPRPRPVVAPGG